MTRTVLTFVGRVADHNDRGMAGSRLVGRALADRLGLEWRVAGVPEPADPGSWEADLTAATPGLLELQAAHDEVLADEQPALITLPRCAASLATLPNLAGARPDAAVVWIDAHADLNTPVSTPTGYLGGMVLSAAAGWWDSGLGAGLDAHNILLVGTRDFDPFERTLADNGVIKLASGPSMLEALDDLVGARPIYVHLDCDVLEPGIVPTDYLVPDGLSLADLNAVALRLASNEVVGVEIAEFESPADPADAMGCIAPLLDALDPLFG